MRVPKAQGVEAPGLKVQEVVDRVPVVEVVPPGEPTSVVGGIEAAARALRVQAVKRIVVLEAMEVIGVVAVGVTVDMVAERLRWRLPFVHRGMP